MSRETLAPPAPPVPSPQLKGPLLRAEAPAFSPSRMSPVPSSERLTPESKESKLEVKEQTACAPQQGVPVRGLEGHLEAFWRVHSVEEVWETRVPTLTRVHKKLVGPLSYAWLSVLLHRLRRWDSDSAHAAEVLFAKCVLRTLPPANKGRRPLDVLRQRLDDWLEGRLEELWAAATAPQPPKSVPALPLASRVSASRIAALVEDFHLSAAVKALNAEPPAKVNDESYAAMEERHPRADPPDLGEAPVFPPHSVVPERVLECVREFKTTSAGAMSGLRPAHLRFFLGTHSQVDILVRMTEVVNKMLTGTLPVMTRRYVCGANLTALAKKDGGLRPIACGDVWRRLTAKCVCKNFADDFRGSLARSSSGWRSLAELRSSSTQPECCTRKRAIATTSSCSSLISEMHSIASRVKSSWMS